MSRIIHKIDNIHKAIKVELNKILMFYANHHGAIRVRSLTLNTSNISKWWKTYVGK